jgi:hypothetical protein
LGSVVVDRIRWTPNTPQQPRQVCLHFESVHHLRPASDRTSTSFTTISLPDLPHRSLSRNPHQAYERRRYGARSSRPQLRSHSYSGFNSCSLKVSNHALKGREPLLLPRVWLFRLLEYRLRWRLTSIFWRIRCRWVGESGSKTSNFKSTNQMAISFD